MIKNDFEINIGDVFKLGEHYLVYGDSTKTEYIENIMKDKKIKAIVTDPPYGIDYVNSKKGFFKNEINHKNIENDSYQSDDEYSIFTEKWMGNIKQYLEDKNSFYIFNSDKMIFSLKDSIDKLGFKFSQLLIWVKNGGVIGRLDYLPQHELIAYGWFGKHEFLRSKGKTVYSYPKPNKNTIHPTMKPISLLREIILNSSRIGDYICDPFLGSGSTLIACEQTKRKCIGIEFEKEYVEKIIIRYEKLFNIKAKKLA